MILLVVLLLNVFIRYQKRENFQSQDVTRIFVGKSSRAKKTINLPLSNLVASPVPDNIADLTQSYEFSVTINNRKLTLSRTDSNEGWTENIYINVSGSTKGVNTMFMEQVFVDMLGRTPNTSEITAYNMLLNQKSITGVINRLYTLEEAANYRRNNPDKKVSRILSLPYERTIDIVYLELVNRKPEPQERTSALEIINNSGYSELVNTLYITSEAQNFRTSGETNNQNLLFIRPSREITQQEQINNKCNFIPWGPSKRACMDRCRVDRNIWGGDNCTIARCNDICSSCTNKKQCKWLNTRDFTEERREQIRNNPLPELNIKLRGIEGDTECLIQFIHDSRVESYYLHYFKSASPNRGIKVLHIHTPNEGLNTIPILNLTNNEAYTFILIPVKDNEKLNLTNDVVLTPKKYLNLRQ